MHKRALFEGRGNLTSTAQVFDWKPIQGLTLCRIKEKFGGEGGIRTPGTVPRTLDFESSAFNRARPPLRWLITLVFLSQPGEKFAEKQRACFGRNSSGHRQPVVQPLVFAQPV